MSVLPHLTTWSYSICALDELRYFVSLSMYGVICLLAQLCVTQVVLFDCAALCFVSSLIVPYRAKVEASLRKFER